jgi:hypothetical protein
MVGDDEADERADRDEERKHGDLIGPNVE